jgi:hypothetical protein
VGMLLWAVETAAIPVRVDDLTIKPRAREGFDDLTIDLSVSTLSSIPEPAAPGHPTVSMADQAGGQP